MNKKTILYERHVAAGGNMVLYAGYEMPVHYRGGIIAEHAATRKSVGMFDVSHMGEVMVEGEGALAFLQNLLTNDMAGMQIGTCRYSPMCNEQGGVVDDLIAYKFGENRYLLVVNAANKDKDIDWMRAHATRDVRLIDRSDSTSEIALQGPRAKEILRSLLQQGDLPSVYYTFSRDIWVAGVLCLVSRTGYTGEDGYEIYCENECAPKLWDALLDAGEPLGLTPCGLAARDTLRLEAGLPLYGHEMDEQITPREAGLGSFVKLKKSEGFIGKAALIQKGKPARRRSGLRVTGRGIAREGCDVYVGDVHIGIVTSGTMLPYVGYAGAMALLHEAYREIGTQVQVDVRGRRVDAQVIQLPFYKREAK